MTFLARLVTNFRVIMLCVWSVAVAMSGRSAEVAAAAAAEDAPAAAEWGFVRDHDQD